MTVSPWLRLWLPLGNMLLLIAIVETVDLIRNEMKDVGIFIYQSFSLYTVDFSEFYVIDTIMFIYLSRRIFLFSAAMPELIFLTVAIVVRLVATVGLLWIGAIIKGSLGCLLAWIIITVIYSVGLTIFLIINAVVAAQYEIDRLHAWSIAYSFLIFVVFSAYIIFIASVSYKALSRKETLHPIGKGLVYIWEYFSNESKIAAMFFLTSEIVLDAEYLVSRQFIQFFGVRLHGHDGDSYPPIIVEEIVLQVMRIVTNAIGIWLVSTDRRRVFRWWCAFTFLLILVSTCIFIILTVQWRGEDISSTLAYFIMFPGHLLYRFVTLYFCLKFTRADFSSFVL